MESAADDATIAKSKFDSMPQGFRDPNHSHKKPTLVTNTCATSLEGFVAPSNKWSFIDTVSPVVPHLGRDGPVRWRRREELLLDVLQAVVLTLLEDVGHKEVVVADRGPGYTPDPRLYADVVDWLKGDLHHLHGVGLPALLLLLEDPRAVRHLTGRTVDAWSGDGRPIPGTNKDQMTFNISLDIEPRPAHVRHALSRPCSSPAAPPWWSAAGA